MSVVHTSRLRIEKHEGPHRTAHIENFPEPIHFGINGGINESVGGDLAYRHQHGYR